MSSVVLWQHEEPTKTIQIAVVRVLCPRLRIWLGGELGDKASGSGHGLFREAFQPGPGNAGGGRAGLARGSRSGPLREPEPDERYPALHDEKVGCHLTEPPVVVRARYEVRVGRPGDPSEEPIPFGGRTTDQQADRLPEPRGPVRRVIHDSKGHRRIMRPCPFVQNAARTKQAIGRTGGIRGWDLEV